MPARSTQGKLSALQPTQAEIERAEADLVKLKADKNKISSVKAGLKHYTKTVFPEDDKIKVSDEEFLKRFLIAQYRSKESQKDTTGSEGKKTTKAKGRKVDWFGEEKMDEAVGAKKALHWRESGMLKPRPDMLTGSTDRWNIEWPVPHDWENMTDEDIKNFFVNFKIDGVDDAEPIDLLRARDIGLGESGLLSLSASSGSAPNVIVKVENGVVVTGNQEMAKRVVELKHDVNTVLKEFQGYDLTAKQIQKKAVEKNCPFESYFLTDLDTHAKALPKLIKILEKMAIYEADDSKLPQVIETIDRLRSKDSALVEWYVKYNYQAAVPIPKKKARKA